MALSLEEDGATRQARVVAVRALKKATKAFPDDDLRLAKTKILLGRILRKSFATTEAKRILEEAYPLLKGKKAEKLLIAECAFELGWAHYLLAEMEDGKKCFQEALQLRKEKLADQHEDVISSIARLAAVASYQKNFATANRLFARALELTKQSFGRSSAEAAEVLNDMAQNFSRQNSPRATDCLKRALAIREALFRKGDARSEVKLLSTIDELATLLLEKGKKREVIGLIDRKIEIVGPRSLMACGDAEELGKIHLELKNYERAESAFLLSLQNLERAFGQGSDKCKGPIKELVFLYEQWGKQGKSKAMQDRLKKKGQ